MDGAKRDEIMELKTNRQQEWDIDIDERKLYDGIAEDLDIQFLDK